MRTWKFASEIYWPLVLVVKRKVTNSSTKPQIPTAKIFSRLSSPLILHFLARHGLVLCLHSNSKQLRTYNNWEWSIHCYLWFCGTSICFSLWKWKIQLNIRKVKLKLDVTWDWKRQNFELEHYIQEVSAKCKLMYRAPFRTITQSVCYSLQNQPVCTVY